MHPTKWIGRRLESIGRGPSASYAEINKTQAESFSDSLVTLPSSASLTLHESNSDAAIAATSHEAPLLPPIQRVASPPIYSFSNITDSRAFMPRNRPQSTSHRALESYDILMTILEAFLPDQQLDRKSLVYAALVSRAFSEPASSILWREISNMEPLWRILHPDPLVGFGPFGRTQGQTSKLNRRDAVAQAVSGSNPF